MDPAIAGTPAEGRPPAEAMPFETAALPDVAPDARDAPPFWEPEPTQMMDAVELERQYPPEQQPPQPFSGSVFPEGTELLPGAAAPHEPVSTVAAPPGETQQLSALDALFGENQFREYEGGSDPSQSPFARRDPAPSGGGPGGGGPPAPAAGVSGVQKVLLIVLGAILATLALVALFFLGMRLPDLLGPAPAVTAPSASPSPSVSPSIPVGPVVPGEYHWDELLGGECLDPYQSPWQDSYTVVDCDLPHAAQLVRIFEYPIPESGPEPYPGEDVLQERALERCRGEGIFDTDVKSLKDAQVEVSYPVSAEDWNAGDRSFSCFVSRTSGDPITGDIALPQPTPTPEPEPEP